jgi:hypothetical protein
MILLTISDAARRCGVDRRTLQRAIARGHLTRTASGQVTLEALALAGYHPVAPHQDAAPMAHEVRHAAEVPHIMPHETPQELPLVTALLAHLEQLTRTIVALHQEVILLREDLRQTPQRRRGLTPHDMRHTAGEPQGDAAPVPHHEALMPQETPHHDTAGTPRSVTSQPQVTPQADAAPMPQHDALTPHEPPQAVTPVTPTPQVTPQESATPESPTTLPPYLLTIAEVAAAYNKLTLVELAQLLYDRNIYRSTDRKTGAAKPVNKGTLQRWLAMARQAGLL